MKREERECTNMEAGAYFKSYAWRKKKIIEMFYVWNNS